jgi:hypothetical protein
VLNATFSNILAILGRPVLVVEEDGVLGENHQATGKLYHLRLRVECALFYNLQSRHEPTNIIERNNLERDQGQKIAVVTSGGLMRNSEPQNLYSSVNPTDDRTGAMSSCSPESSSNNISTGNDQIGQGYQSSIGTDAEPYISSVNNERVHDLENKTGMM